jgi:dihydrofolate reductase
MVFSGNMQPSKLSLIVAVSHNGVIGRRGELPWKLSADLQRFKRLTMGHHIVMGRKTFESIGRLLPGRTSVIVTRQPEYHFAGAVVVHSLADAISLAEGDDELFVIGGGEIYQEALPLAARIYLTRVHVDVEGDAFFPEPASDQWTEVSRNEHATDAKNQYDHSFVVFERTDPVRLDQS